MSLDKPSLLAIGWARSCDGCDEVVGASLITAVGLFKVVDVAFESSSTFRLFAHRLSSGFTCVFCDVSLLFPCLFMEGEGPMFRSNDGKAMTMSIQSRERQQSLRLLYTDCLFIKRKGSVCLSSSIQLVIGYCFIHSRQSNQPQYIHETERTCSLCSSWLLSTEVVVQTCMFHFLCWSTNTQKYWREDLVLVKSIQISGEGGRLSPPQPTRWLRHWFGPSNLFFSADPSASGYYRGGG